MGRAIGREITARARPQLSLVRPLSRPRPGQLLRLSRGFGMRLGLSQQNRALLADTTSVRPPIDYWPWPDAGADVAADAAASQARSTVSERARRAPPAVAAAPAEPPRTVDPLVEALRRKVLKGKTPNPAAAPAAAAVPTPVAPVAATDVSRPVVSPRHVVRRGLPLTPRRFGRTWAGPGTSPGGVANGAAPQVTTTVAPTRFGGQSATELPAVASSGIADSGGAAASRQPVSGRPPRPSMDDAEGLRRKLARDTVPISSGPPPTRGLPADDDWAMPKPKQPLASSASLPSASPLRRAIVRADHRLPEPQADSPPGRASVATMEHPRITSEFFLDATPPITSAAPITTNGRSTLVTAPAMAPLVVDAVASSGATIEHEVDVSLAADTVVVPPRGLTVVDPSQPTSSPAGVIPAGVAPAGATESDALPRATSKPLPRVAQLDRTDAPQLGAAAELIRTRPAIGVLRRATPAPGIARRSAVAGATVLRRGVAGGERTIDGRAVRRQADAGPLLESATFMHSLRPHAVPAHTAAPAAQTPAAAAGRITPATIASAGRQRLASIGRAVVVQRRPAPTAAIATDAVAPTVDAPASLADIDTLLGQIEAMGGWDSLLDELGVVAPTPSAAAALARVTSPLEQAGDDSSTRGRALVSDELDVVAPTPSSAAALVRDVTVDDTQAPAVRARLLDDLRVSGPNSRDTAIVARRVADDHVPTDVATRLADELGVVAPAAFVRETPENRTPESWVPTHPGSLFSSVLGAPAEIAGAAVRPGVARVAAATPTPPAEPDLGDRFMAELGRHRQERARPLPVQFRSIADVIVADRTPRISTSLASRQALAAVDKVAATTGDVIHLARAPSGGTPSAELAGVIAHELTHVANPSPAPRFFDDDRHSAEERRATEIGEIMRSTRLRPVAAPRPSRGAPMSITTDFDDATENIRRRVASSGSSNDGPDTIQRKFSGTMGGHRARPSDTSATTASSTNTVSQGESSSGSSPTGSSISRAEFRKLLRENFDTVVELLEDRLISDLERRGGRYRSDF